MGLIDLFKKLGAFVKRALGLAQQAGLTDDLVRRAMELCRTAADELATNEERRRWVLAMLMGTGIPESIARLALELGLQLLKSRET